MIDTYYEKSKKLFDEWKEKIQGFAEDGVVCPEKWFSSDVRPMFLLKEAYNFTENGSLIEDVLKKENEETGNTWRNVSLWTKGILTTTADEIPCYSNDESIRFYNNEFLQRTAIVNVKKYNGENGSKADDLLKYVKEHCDKLRKQIELCEPTVIVCGNTGKFLKIIFPEQSGFMDEKNDNLFYYLTINSRKVIVIDYWHPANQFPRIMNFYSLMEIYRQALLNK